MIVDLHRFLATEKPYWTELEELLKELAEKVERRFDLDEAKRFHYLYERAAADLVRLADFPSERRIQQYLEPLVAEAYAEIHETRERPHRFSPFVWFFRTFPQTFRRHITAFLLALIITSAGSTFGGLAVSLDPGSKEILLPFAHLRIDPSERVDYEESRREDHIGDQATSMSSMYMTHNTKVSIFTLAMGITWGIGTVIVLFFNGAILGAVVCDYVLAGEVRFLAGWLLPHGVVEIPAILIAGQAGLMLGRALIGRGMSSSVRWRLRAVSNDLVTLIFGVAILLVWAGIVEAFLSQYHEPVLPYWLKITFGVVELSALVLLLTKSGKGGDTGDKSAMPLNGSDYNHA